MDQRPYRTAVAAAQAELKKAQATLAFAEQQNARANKLVLMSAISREEAEEKKAAYQQSLASLAVMQAGLDKAVLELKFTEVRSPIDGRVSRARLTPGNLAVGDISELTTVVSQDPVYIYFDPDERTLLKYDLAKQLHGHPVLNIGLATDDGYPYEGVLDFIDNHVNSSTGTVRARARVKNPDGRITPGLYAKVKIALGEPQTVMTVPDRAILTDQSKKYVYVLDGNDKAERRYIKVGDLVGKDRIVESGLLAIDKVVVAGFHQIFASGTPVSPVLKRNSNKEMQASAVSDMSNLE
ncbi:efflux RND transporter periplasmic adaptor subunit [Pseudomonas sp. PhalM4]